MPFVIIETAGTFDAFDSTYTLGATEVAEDDPIVAYIREGNAPDWVQLRESRKVEPELEPKPLQEEPAREPLVPFEGRDGQFYFVSQFDANSAAEQHGPYETTDVAEAAAKQLEEEHANRDTLVPTVEEVDAQRTAVGEFPAPAAGESGFSTEDLPGNDGKVHCRGEGCDREFKNTGARTNHERAKHPELFEPKAPAESDDDGDDD